VLFIAAASTTACAAIWGFQDSLDVADGSTDGAAHDGSRDSGSQDAYDAPVIVDAPTPSDAAVKDPCTTTVPETYAYYVSSHSGTDNDTCGPLSAPCATISRGMDNAHIKGPTIVNVAEGNYSDQLTLFASLTVVGGWLEGGGKWAKDTSSGAFGNLVVQPTTGFATVVASSLGGGPATLCTLTLESKKNADPGETLYGVMATGPSTTLQLFDVGISVSPGGDAPDATNGDPGAPGDKNGCGPPGTGAMGAPSGTAGTAGPVGAFTGAGYQPGNGSSGSVGALGVTGSAGGSGSCITCDTSCLKVTSLICNPNGTTSSCGDSGISGCAGKGGEPGTGGGGGGSSVGVFVWEATVTIKDSRLVVARGGNGAQGGAGGDGGAGALGVPGPHGATPCDTQCVTTPSCGPGVPDAGPGGTAGGVGGSGSSGGPGGGGSGGFSCPVVEGGDAAVAIATSVVTPGLAGQGAKGAPPGGIGNDAGVCSF
jgi:hypothetical protein